MHALKGCSRSARSSAHSPPGRSSTPSTGGVVLESAAAAQPRARRRSCGAGPRPDRSSRKAAAPAAAPSDLAVDATIFVGRPPRHTAAARAAAVKRLPSVRSIGPSGRSGQGRGRSRVTSRLAPDSCRSRRRGAEMTDAAARPRRHLRTTRAADRGLASLGSAAFCGGVPSLAAGGATASHRRTWRCRCRRAAPRGRGGRRRRARATEAAVVARGGGARGGGAAGQEDDESAARPGAASLRVLGHCARRSQACSWCCRLAGGTWSGAWRVALLAALLLTAPVRDGPRACWATPPTVRRPKTRRTTSARLGVRLPRRSRRRAPGGRCSWPRFIARTPLALGWTRCTRRPLARCAAAGRRGSSGPARGAR